MKTENRDKPEGVVVFNYAKAKSSVPAADTIDTLVNAEVMKHLTDGDPTPYFKIEAIDYPAKGSGGIYDKSFFKSYLAVMKNRPIPGSKRGHEYTSRPSSDFYTVGGRLDENADGKTGTVFFKIYIPPKGDPTENSGFIRDAKANIVNFSLVTAPDYKVVTEKDEAGNTVQVRHYTTSMGYERNDAVEYGAGAMAQTVNSANDTFDFDAARALIEAGDFDKTSKIDGGAIQNGIVYRTGLRRMQSSPAYAQNASELASLISLIDKTKTNGGKTVDIKEEALELLGNALKNSQTNTSDIAKALGFEVRSPEDVKNAETIKALNAKLGDKPVERLDSILAENAKNAEATVKNTIAAFPGIGPEKIKNAKTGKDEENPAFTRALEKCAGKSGDELKNALESLKDDAVMKVIQANRADSDSQINRMQNGGAQSSATAGAIPALKV